MKVKNNFTIITLYKIGRRPPSKLSNHQYKVYNVYINNSNLMTINYLNK